MSSVSMNKGAEGCATPIKLASHPPSPPSSGTLSTRSAIAITRRQRNEISLQHSLRLRSRAVPHTQPAKPPLQQSHQKRRQQAGPSSPPAPQDRVDGKIGRQPPQPVESLVLHREKGAGRHDPTGLQTKDGEVCADVVNAEGTTRLLNNLTSPQPPSPSAESMHSELLEITGAKTVPLAHGTLHEVQNPECIGVPKDGNWDHTAAYETRFCVQHEEDEWLLGSVHRWMYSNDFDGPGAEAALEAKFRKYESEPWDLNRHRLAS